MAFIELIDVNFTYPNCNEPAIRNLSLEINKGQFVVLFGSSGSGKSTLLRLLKKEIQPHGDLSGVIQIAGKLQQDTEDSAEEIGFVFQDPENQIVADDVLHEIVFGLENMGLSTNEMRNRVAEMVHFFGAEPLLHKKAHELSGGKKQQINLASALLMQPNILLLDEPTAQLDPVSTREFLDILKRLNEEFGMTIIIAEHRLEEVFTLADQIVFLEQGQIKVAGDPRVVLNEIWDSSNRAFIPSIPALFLRNGGEGILPLSVKEGRAWAQNSLLEEALEIKLTISETPSGKDVIHAKNITFRYEKKGNFILDELDFQLKKGELYALLGGNGSGKSTLLKVIAGLLKVEAGKVLLDGKPLKGVKQKDRTQRIGYLPQNPKLFFIHDTVRKELEEAASFCEEANSLEVESLLEHLGIAHLMSSHPYDLSGGELQKAALACLLKRKPEILLLDEPTKGLDPISKANLADMLSILRSQGMTILISTHDVEFAAQYATRCGMMFQGKITSEEVPRKFFTGNFFYTTMIQRVFRDMTDHVPMTLEEVMGPCAVTRV